MFTGNLKHFQIVHEQALLAACKNHKELVLQSPTGSGKTVLACKFIDDYLDENPNTVFLWLCPGAGSLEVQSQDSFVRFTTGINYGDVYSFLSEPDPSSSVYFINWDKINKKSNTVLRESEYMDLMTKIQYCHSNNIDIFMIIDEEHKYQKTANTYVANIQPIHVLRISATSSTRADYIEVIKDKEVINAGLIASAIAVNEGISHAIAENNDLDDDLLLLDLADKKRKQIQKEYETNPSVDNHKMRPLVLIQFPNGSDEWIERVKEHLSDMGYTEESGLVASWFSGDHPDNPEEIQKLDGKYAFLLFKQAIATGWDCPRAKILVKLREGGTESFQIQTVGRIRRMPERKLYDNHILDHCYIYTLDNKFSDELLETMTDAFMAYNYTKKDEAPSMALVKEVLDGNDKYLVDPRQVVKVVYRKMLEIFDEDGNRKLDRQEFINAGFVLGTKLKAEAYTGVAYTTKDMSKLTKVYAGEHQINTHDDGFIIRDAKRRIAAAIRVPEQNSNNAMRTLFCNLDVYSDGMSEEELEFENEYKLIDDMSLREFNAFLVNNKEKLIDLFKDIDAHEVGEVRKTGISIRDWEMPQNQYYKVSKKHRMNYVLNSNTFNGYGDNILHKPNRSNGEIEFEKWCETHKEFIKWCYKNGDKGDEFFSVVYDRVFVRANFYPDYLCEDVEGNIWIIEAKGGANAAGDSENIDSYANKKFEALKKYVDKYKNVKWGFVRLAGSQLYMSNTEWDEDITNEVVWRPIEEFFK